MTVFVWMFADLHLIFLQVREVRLRLFKIAERSLVKLDFANAVVSNLKTAFKSTAE